MKKDKLSNQSREYENARYAGYDDFEDDFEVARTYGSSWDSFAARIQTFSYATVEMLRASVRHLRQPSTLIVIFLLIGAYILLGIAGQVQFSFFSNETVQYVQTNLDIAVNALLGFFYGPVTCAIGVALCTTVRMITNGSVFFVGYIIGAFVAGFMHGWILYRLKTMWFLTRIRGFYTGLLVRVVKVRLYVSVFVNIVLMSLIYRILINYPFIEFLKYYSKSGVAITSPAEFLSIFFVSIAAESLIVFAIVCIVNFIVSKAFPNRFAEPSLIVGGDGSITSIEEEMAFEEN